MSHVLSSPTTEFSPAQLALLQRQRLRGVVLPSKGVRVEASMAMPELRFAKGDPGLPVGTPVMVSWRGGGLVCDSIAVLEAAEARATDVQRQVELTRLRLAQARLERQSTMAGTLDEIPVSASMY